MHIVPVPSASTRHAATSLNTRFYIETGPMYDRFCDGEGCTEKRTTCRVTAFEWKGHKAGSRLRSAHAVKIKGAQRNRTCGYFVPKVSDEEGNADFPEEGAYTRAMQRAGR
jgi:hypothetical protein